MRARASIPLAFAASLFGCSATPPPTPVFATSLAVEVPLPLDAPRARMGPFDTSAPRPSPQPSPIATLTPVPLPVPFPSLLAPSYAPVPSKMGAINLTHDLIPFVSNRAEGGGKGSFDIFIFDRTAHTVFAPPGANTPGDELDPSLTFNNRWLVYATTVHGDSDIWLYDMATQLVDTLPTLNTRADDVSPSINGDGTVIAYTSHEQGLDRLNLFDLRANANIVPAVVQRLGTTLNNPAISPDGLWVAFSTPTPENDLDIELYDVAHARVGPPPCLNTELREDEPAWSPDGQRLLFSTNRHGNEDVMLYDMVTHTTDPLPLANSPCDDLTPSFLGAAGDQVLFVSDRTGKPDRRMYVYQLASHELDTLPTAHDLGRIDTFSAP